MLSSLFNTITSSKFGALGRSSTLGRSSSFLRHNRFEFGFGFGFGRETFPRNNRFGFGRGTFPPLPRRFTRPFFRDESESVEVTKQGAIVDFSNKITLTVGFNPTNNDPAFTTEIVGDTKIVFGKSKDAIKDDPLLGTVGRFDGRFDVGKSEIVSSTSTGQTPLGDVITVNIGDGNPDLMFNPVDEAMPPLSLASGGAFSLEADNLLSYSGETKSFYKIFLEIQDAPNGTLRNRTPIVVESDFSDGILSQDQLNLTYSSSSVVPLFTAGADGIFWTGDEQVGAKLVPGANGNSLTVNLSADLS
ncbi:MAG: hypothetical protein AB8B99_13915 [Phormidesmis sp.]